MGKAEGLCLRSIFKPSAETRTPNIIRHLLGLTQDLTTTYVSPVIFLIHKLYAAFQRGDSYNNNNKIVAYMEHSAF